MIKKEKKYSLYSITYEPKNVNDKNYGKIYIGQTTQNPPTNRWTGHKAEARRSSKKNMYITRALIAHGVENFKFQIIAEYKNLNDLSLGEIEVIAQYNSRDRNFRYNLSIGGGIIDGENNPMYGKTHTKEVKMKLSNAAKLRVGDKNPFFGKKHSDETKQKQSDVKIGNMLAN